MSATETESQDRRGDPTYCMLCGKYRGRGCTCPHPPQCLQCKAINWNCDCGTVEWCNRRREQREKEYFAMTPKPVAKPKVTPKPIRTKPEPVSVGGGDLDNIPQAVEATGDRVHFQIGKTIKLPTQFEMLRVDYGETTIVQPGETVEQARERLRDSVLSSMKELVEVATEAMTA